jgi:hypothetical protein
MVLFAQGDDEGAGGVGFGLGLGSGPAWAKEVERPVAELAAEDAEGSWGVAKEVGDLLGRKVLDKIGAQGFVLPLGGRLGLEEEPGFIC